jgi:predicted MFS family arabinose efflux permease
MNSKIIEILLPIICGLTAANMYYIQSLVPAVTNDLNINYSLASMIYTLSLIGNAVSLIFIAPLGDFLDRKSMIVKLYALLSLATLLFYFSTNIYVLLAIAFLIGIGVSVVPIIISYLSMNKISGINSIGRIMAGILLGALFSRFLASAFESLWGWKSIYLFAVICMICSFTFISFFLPKDTGEKPPRGHYAHLIKSTFSLLITDSNIKMCSFLGFMVMAIFASFWNNISIYLFNEFDMSQLGIGLFSLTGVAGASAALFANRILKIIGYSNRLLCFLLALSFLLLWLDSINLILLAVGALFLDAFIQLIHVNNQVNMYKFCKGNESRAASCYMTSFTLGGAFGAKLSSTTYLAFGWKGICIFCMVIAITCLIPKQKYNQRDTL